MKFLLALFVLLSSVALNAQQYPDTSITNKFTKTNEIYSFTEYMPRMSGGEAAFQTYLNTNTRYPKSAIDNRLEGIAYVYFVVERDSSISTVKLQKGIPHAPELDSEAVRLIRDMPKWNPGTMYGQPVRVGMTVPVRFVLRTSLAKSNPSSMGIDSSVVIASGVGDTAIYMYSAVMPFVPGYLSLREYTLENIKYPKSAVKAKKRGTARVRFIVEKDGSVSRVVLMEGIPGAPELDAEAIRVISAIPKMNPGTVMGKPVRVEMVHAVEFYIPTK